MVTPARPPRGAIEFREALGADVLDFGQSPTGRSDGAMLGTLFGYALKWDTWSEILESGNRFLESFSAQSMDRTIRERGGSGKIKMLYGHGSGPISDMPLGPLTVEADRVGLRYESQLLDTSFNRDLAQILRVPGLMGASVRFSVVRDEFTAKPARTSFNKSGFPTRRITEARLLEISAVTWPASVGTSATLRSSTDAWTLQRLEDDPERFEELRAVTAARRPAPVDTGPKPKWWLP